MVANGDCRFELTVAMLECHFLGMTEWTKQLRATGGEPTGAEIRNAATVALLRDGAGGLEVLMGKRATKLDFHGGSWVFPGGRIDDDDWAESGGDILVAARFAAAREAMEEAGVVVDSHGLVHFSNWTTPVISPKRFATWFFVGRAGTDHDQAKADGVESDAVRWMTPELALAERTAGAIEIAPPQFVSLLHLSRFDHVDEALAVLATEDPIDFQPAFHFLEGGGAVAIYDGDVAYENVELLEVPGARHRFLMSKDSGWVYEKD